jgi:hypothetical protein
VCVTVIAIAVLALVVIYRVPGYVAAGAIGKRVEIYCAPYIRTFMACAQVSADKGNHFILELFHFGELNATALNRFCSFWNGNTRNF